MPKRYFKKTRIVFAHLVKVDYPSVFISSNDTQAIGPRAQDFGVGAAMRVGQLQPVSGGVVVDVKGAVLLSANEGRICVGAQPLGSCQVAGLGVSVGR